MSATNNSDTHSCRRVEHNTLIFHFKNARCGISREAFEELYLFISHPHTGCHYLRCRRRRAVADRPRSELLSKSKRPVTTRGQNNHFVSVSGSSSYHRDNHSHSYYHAFDPDTQVNCARKSQEGAHH